MKNLLIVLVIALAGGTLYYMAQQSGKQGYEPNGALEYVPADTAVFSGQLHPFPLRDYLVATANNYQNPSSIPLDMLETPQERFFYALFEQYTSQLKQPDEFIKSFGLDNRVEGYFYTLGLIPVMKLQIKEPAAFYGQLDAAEQSSGWSHTVRKVGELNVRAYELDDESGDIQMLVSDHKGWLTMTLAFAGQDPVTLEQSLGLKAVENNLTQTTLLKDIVKRHGFLSESVSYINHQTIVAALTKGEGLMGQQLTKLAELSDASELQEIRTAECQQEMAGIAANWPMTVAGLTHMSVDERHADMDVRTVIESNNSKVMSALQSLRGFIAPAASRMGDSVFSVGLGLDSDNLASSLNQVWQEMMTPQMQCLPLAAMQSELSQANPAMLGMFSGMAQGAKGVSVVVSGFELDEYGEPKSVDAMVSLAVEDPQTLYAMSASFLPQLAGVQLPADGSPIDVTDMLGLPPIGKVMLAAKGKHLVLYTGSRSTELANELGVVDSIKPNGIMVMTADYKKVFTPLFDVMEAMGEEIPPEIEGMKDANMKVLFDFDVTDKGLVFDTRMAAKSE
ncbi:hypothetical protein L2750_02835 [Shewanella submarina]|uniref:DUF3352 domain-containing protein n=1 Tax=Shewanella submarina TaxID=2016376 RepID=A0ABV7GJP9_9GAMM|nr:hypothetical protein [Shewanella submarina]MCL1036091.1 hypothetical protein [Shewanella submarina]